MLPKKTFLNLRKITSNLRSIKVTNPIELSEDALAVIKRLREYLENAEAGRINGVCLIALRADQTYDIDCVGHYQKYPTDALGPLRVLDLKLSRKALDEH